MTTIDRRTFLQRTGVASGAALAASGPLGAFTSQAMAAGRQEATGYGPLVLKTDERTGRQLMLPRAFDFVVVQQQGEPMRDGEPTPGVFDGMGAFSVEGPGTVLIRNHENRERAGETKVVTGPLEYDPLAFGGNTKLVVDTQAVLAKQPPYVLDSFAILGGTSSNCAGGETPWGSWITCEEVVKRSPNGKKHGYVFEMDADADGPLEAIPAPQFGRFVHEAIAYHAGIFYLTEDKSIQVLGETQTAPAETLGSCFYRFVPDRRPGRNGNIADLTGRLEALMVVGEPKANMDVGREPGQTYDVTWVPVPEPDHDDDTDNRRDRVPGFTPTRVQAIDNGAAIFDREEGAWVGNGRVFFDCTSGGEAGLGQIWEYDPAKEQLTLVFESNDATRLQAPDNITIVPSTGDIFAQEDGGGDQFVRGITQDGRIYDFAQTVTSDSEFCGGCFDPNGKILYLNQQGDRGDLPNGPENENGVTYAIFGPFQQRDGSRRRG